LSSWRVKLPGAIPAARTPARVGHDDGALFSAFDYRYSDGKNQGRIKNCGAVQGGSMIGRDARINLLISTGHFLSHFYQLCLPPLFLVWQRQFDISFAELGLSVVLMTGTAAVLQTPVGFLVDRYGARPFLIGGALVMSLAIALMGFATAFWQILALALISGIGNAVFHPCDYAILAGSIRKERMGRSFALHGFSGSIGFALAPPTITALLSVMDWRGVLLVVGGLGLPVVAALIAPRPLGMTGAVERVRIAVEAFEAARRGEGRRRRPYDVGRRGLGLGGRAVGSHGDPRGGGAAGPRQPAAQLLGRELQLQRRRGPGAGQDHATVISI
jgi:MFS family permease